MKIALAVIATGLIFFSLVLVLAFLVGLGWKWGRGQIVLAYYEFGKDLELAKVRYDPKTEQMVFERRPLCADCEHERKMRELRAQLEDPEEQL